MVGAGAEALATAEDEVAAEDEAVIGTSVATAVGVKVVANVGALPTGSRISAPSCNRSPRIEPNRLKQLRKARARIVETC